MIHPKPHLVIDARPRGPRGLLAFEDVLGRPVLAHLLELAEALGEGPIAVHARLDEHDRLRSSLEESDRGRLRMVTGPPPEDSAILRSDRLYDVQRLKRVILRGGDPESAVIWRLDRPRALEGAGDELIRRRTYQPIGRFWAIGPARWLARRLGPTSIRPNAVTLASGGLVLLASSLVAWAGVGWIWCGLTSAALAIALVLDTSDGHLARLQGTASEFGRWLDANLDELGDMALHAAIAWAAFVRDGSPAWLAVGMLYAMGKYLFLVGSSTALAPAGLANSSSEGLAPSSSRLRSWAILAGHADIRWHLWIILAAVGRLELALVGYAAYFPLRAVAGAARKARRHG